jgi:hypothetical protein
VISFTAPSGNGPDDLLLRRNGSRLELFDNGVLVRSQNLSSLTAATINGVNGENDRLTVDFSAGGLFSIPKGITFNNPPSAGTDRLIVVGTSAANTITMTANSVTVDGSLISYNGVEQLQVNTLAGADVVTMTGLNPATATTVDAGTDTDLDRYAGNFAGNLTLLHFGNVRLHVGGNFSGHWTVLGSGTIDDATIDGSVTDTGMIMTEDITQLMVMGDMSGSVMASGGTITDMTIGGTVTTTGTVMAEDIGQILIVGDLDGTLLAQGSGTIDDAEIDGTVGSTGMIMSEDITQIMVMGDMSGTVMVSAPPVGSGNLDTMIVGGSLTGTVSVEESLGTLMVDGGTSGTVSAGDIGTLSAGQAVAGSPVLQVIEAGVMRRLIATRADNGLPTPPSVTFAYYYDSTGTGDPRLSVRVTNGDPRTSADDVRFDLSLTTSTAAEFDLARLFAVGTSGIRNVAVEGDVLTTVSPAALAFFGLPAGTPGGVRLPLDALAAVAAQDNLVAGNIQAASVQAVAFGSLTANGSTIAAEAATRVDAAGLLAAGTATVPAHETLRVPFAETGKVILFLDTGPSTFDVRNVLFADQMPNNASVTAVVGTAGGAITTVELQGDGGSISTAQPIGGAISSTGPLGDLALSASNGIGDVTAPSIFGNITTNGPIYGTIQTRAGDLGRPLFGPGGAIVGTTVINTTQGISGQIVSRGNLISRVQSQSAFTGVIAAQGDIGIATVNGSGQLVRFGGILSNGQLAGNVVALGNILGDVIASSGLSGRVAAKGRAIAGLSSARIGILGNFNVNGNVQPGSAIVSGGVIGDAAGGTVFGSGAVRGILAAKGGINFGNTGSRAQAAIFENASGPNAAAIDAIFTRNGGQPHGFDLMGFDLAGLGLILTDLLALRVGPDGNLTGPIA